MTRTRNGRAPSRTTPRPDAYAWEPGHTQRALPAAIYGEPAARATQPGVQSATTVSEMIARSGVPRALWYGDGNPTARQRAAQPKVEKADPETTKLLVTRVLAARAAGHGRTQIGLLANLGTGAKICRIERGDVHADEVTPLLAALDKLEGNGVAVTA